MLYKPYGCEYSRLELTYSVIGLYVLESIAVSQYFEFFKHFLAWKPNDPFVTSK